MRKAIIVVSILCVLIFSFFLINRSCAKEYVKVGLTDTSYKQLRLVLEHLGAEPVDLVNQNSMLQYFANIDDNIEQNPIVINEPYFFGHRELDRWIVKQYEDEGFSLRNYLKDNRFKFSNPSEKEFLLPLINIAEVEKEIRGIDALLVGGGRDIEYLFYDKFNPNEKKDLNTHRTRDIVELAFINAALLYKKPILAICRGAQILAVAQGGQMIQDIPDAYPLIGKIHSKKTETEKSNGHDVIVLKNSLLSKVLGLENHSVTNGQGDYIINVNSYHHQAVKAPVETTEVEAYFQNNTSKDRIIEGFVVKTKQFAVGVQWHPERPRAENDEELAMYIFDSNKFFPKDRPYDRALFENFLSCAKKEAICKEYIYKQ